MTPLETKIKSLVNYEMDCMIKRGEFLNFVSTCYQALKDEGFTTANNALMKAFSEAAVSPDDKVKIVIKKRAPK